jgi:hypothetical protein
MRPGKQWELRNCKQQPGESLREYIRRFSKRSTELHGTTDNDAGGESERLRVEPRSEDQMSPSRPSV